MKSLRKRVDFLVSEYNEIARVKAIPSKKSHREHMLKEIKRIIEIAREFLLMLNSEEKEIKNETLFSFSFFSRKDKLGELVQMRKDLIKVEQNLRLRARELEEFDEEEPKEEKKEEKKEKKKVA